MHQLSEKEQEAILEKLEERFLNHMERHPETPWKIIEEKLLTQPEKIKTLGEMERTGGDPDVISHEAMFVDCSPESPKGEEADVMIDGMVE